MMAPLYDNKGEVKYFLGAQIDVTSLVEGGTGVESFARLLQVEDNEHEIDSERRDRMRNVLAELGDLMTDEEVASVNVGRRRAESDASRTNSRVATQKLPPPLFKQRKILGMNNDDERELWPHPHLGRNGRMPGVYQNVSDNPWSPHPQPCPITDMRMQQYLLVRPYPSMRITFTSPALRIPGLLQTRFIDRIGGAAHVREGILDAFESGTSVTAKIVWVIRDRISDDSDPAVGKTRWIHCTPMLGSDRKVGVWMVVMVEEDQSTGKLVDRGIGIGSSHGILADRGRDGSLYGGSEGSQPGRTERTRAAAMRGSNRASDRHGHSETGPHSSSRTRNDKSAGPVQNQLYAEYLRGQKNSGLRPQTSGGELERREVGDQFLDF